MKDSYKLICITFDEHRTTVILTAYSSTTKRYYNNNYCKQIIKYLHTFIISGCVFFIGISY